MEGYVVERKAGWDCHGLPVEREVEKSLGLQSAAQVEAFGASEFNRLCEESVWKFEGEWRNLTKRMGYWLDMDNRYATLDQEYMESEWWALKTLWEKGLLKKGYKVLPYSPKSGCTYSNRDVAEGYLDVTELCCFVRFPLVQGSYREDEAVETSFVAWTSAPWTLPSNVLLAVNKTLNYCYVKVTLPDGFVRTGDEGSHFKVNKNYLKVGEVLVVAKSRIQSLESSNSPYKLQTLGEVKGSDLVGLSYKPPFYGGGSFDTTTHSSLWEVVHADFVSEDAGTGVVHLAPLYGEDDYNVCVRHGVDLGTEACQHLVGLDGCYVGSQYGNRDDPGQRLPEALRGLDVTKAETQEAVLSLLHNSNSLVRAHKVTHAYPHCWRNPSHRLLNYAMEPWFVTVGAPAVRSRMVDLNASPEVHFSPEGVKFGRFGKWLQETTDWCVSRKRTWGCPLPVWECKREIGGCGKCKCVGSRSELRSLLVNPSETPMDLHSDAVDKLRLRCPSCGEELMCREPYVLDCWFDSGCAPFAQWHYPFSFQSSKPRDYNGSVVAPLDFVAEGQDQCRGWFYSLLCVSTTLFDRPAYKHCLSLGLVLDKNGQKMSKSKGNAVNPWTHFNTEGSDALRWYLLRMNAPWADRRFDETMVRSSNQKFFRVLFNVGKWWQKHWMESREARSVSSNEKHLFFDERHNPAKHTSSGVLDLWILSRLAVLVESCNRNFSSSNFHLVAYDLETFLNDDISKTYLRLSRVHFSGVQRDISTQVMERQDSCLHSLGMVLVVFCRLVAPLAPFLVDRLHRCLMMSQVFAGEGPDKLSVHLAPWPKSDRFECLRNPEVEAEVHLLQSLVKKGNVLHERSSRPGRLPMRRAYCAAYSNGDEESEAPNLVSNELASFLAFELNIERMVLPNGRKDFEALLTQTQTPSLSLNMASLRTRFGTEVGSVLKALKTTLGHASDDELLLPGEDPETSDLKSDDVSEPNLSKKQIKRKQKEAAKRRKKQSQKVMQESAMTGPLVSRALEKLQEEGTFRFVSNTNVEYKLHLSDFFVGSVNLPNYAVSGLEGSNGNESEGLLKIGLVLDFSVGPAQVSTYLVKEVMHCVHRLRKTLEKRQRKGGAPCLNEISLDVVVDKEEAFLQGFSLDPEQWSVLLDETNSRPSASSFCMSPSALKLKLCEKAVEEGEMECLRLRGFRGCPAFTVFVRCCRLDNPF